MGSEKIAFGSTVFLAYSDNTGTAIRALLGLVDIKDVYALNLPVPETNTSVCISFLSDLTLAPVQVINTQHPINEDEKFTFLIINTYFTGEISHLVAEWIVNLCVERGVKKFVILCTQRLDIQDHNNVLFENVFNGMGTVTQKSHLPDDTLISDSFLSNIIQLCMVEGQPFSCLIAPAHRIGSGPANKDDGSLQLIHLFQDIISDYCGLTFSEKISSNLMYHGMMGNLASESLMYA